MNVKTETKEYFDRVAEEYLDRYYSGQSVRYPNLQLRAQILLETVGERLPKGSRILDAGCGAGHLLLELGKIGYCVEGVDTAPNMVQATRALIDTAPSEVRARCSVREGDLETLSPDGCLYDGVVLSGVFEYLEEDDRAFQQLRRLTRPGGLILASFRNRLFNLFSANEYTLQEVEQGTLKNLLSAWFRALEEAQPKTVQRRQQFYAAVAKNVKGLETDDRNPTHGDRSGETPQWEKRMPRRQHTVEQVRALAEANGLTYENTLFFHFHVLPPRVQDLMPAFAHAVSLALETFRETELGHLLASGFVSVLRV